MNHNHQGENLPTATTHTPVQGRGLLTGLRRNLAFKLSFYIGFLALGAMLLLAWHVILTQQKQLTEEVVRDVATFSETLVRSTKRAMLHYQPDDIQAIVNSVGDQEGVVKLRIFNKDGLIQYDRQPSQVGRTVDMKADACYVCHAENQPLTRLSLPARTRFYKTENQNVTGMITPIYNEPTCYQAACHIHPPGQTVLGVLDVAMSLTKVEEKVEESIRWTVLFTLLAFAGLTGLTSIYLYYFVHRPIQQVSQGARAMAAGQRAEPISIRTRDELADMAIFFNEMSLQVQERETALGGAVAKTEAIINTASDAIISFKKDDYVITGSNPSADQIFGYDSRALIGRPITDLFDPDMSEQILGTLLIGGCMEILGRRHDGPLIPMEGLVVQTGAGPDTFYVGTFRDITARKDAESSLIKSESRYRTIFENTGAASILVEDDGTISLANQEFQELSGLPRDEIEGRRKIFNFFEEKDRSRIMDYHVRRRIDPALAPSTYESQFQDAQGRLRPVLVSVAMIPGTKTSITSILDLTDLRRTEESLTRQRAYFRQLFENSPQGIVLVDAAGIIIDVNPGFEALFGFTAGEVKGQTSHYMMVPDDFMAEAEAFARATVTGRTIRKETWRRHKDGRRIPVSVLGYPIRINEEIVGVYYIYHDISERRAFEEQLSHQAFHDALTGLPNRALLMERIERAIARRKRRPDYAFAVLLIDLDRFKLVNDSLGHLAGDALLVQVASGLEGSVRNVDTVARLGGDEFAVIVEEYKTPREVITIAKRMLQILRGPFSLEGHDIYISGSIGIRLNAGGQHTAQEILRDADIAMYRAKELGRARFRVFSKVMHEQALEHLQMENELRLALERGELRLHYQPILTADGLKLEGFEALVRWQHPIKGLIPPNKFIPLAEETGLIVPLGYWVIQEACEKMKKWQTSIDDSSRLSISVNISSRQLLQPDLVSCVAGILKKTSLPASRLKLEITESVFIVDAKTAVERLEQLKVLGIRLAIDDFGTGYSSLSYLQKLPVDCVKIDRSFVGGLGKSHGDLAIVKIIIDMAQTMGLTVVAEGVEKEDQLSTLQSIHCHEVQGFYFSRPVDDVAAAELIRTLSKAKG